MKQFYFPNGRNKSKGLLSLMVAELYGPDHVIIENQKVSVEEYLESKALKNFKMIMKTRKWRVGRDDMNEVQSSDSSDFELAKSRPMHHSTPTNLSTPSTSAVNYSTPALRRLAHRRGDVVPEPSLTDDATVTFVEHISKGKVHRLFLSNSSMADVYTWIGSLAPYPEIFHLCVGLPGNLVIVDTNDLVSSYENRLLIQRETHNSNFTIDILSGSNMSSVPVHTSNVQCSTTVQEILVENSTEERQQKLVRCPVCTEFFVVEHVEEHASVCADQKFLNIVTDDSSDSDDDLLLPKVMGRSEDDSNIKDILKSLNVDLNNAIRLKVRRGRSFQDFCNKMILPWVKEKHQCCISVTFVGEKGVDQGGVSREFFSGNITIFYFLVNCHPMLCVLYRFN